MSFIADTEARRLNLRHLSEVFFHNERPDNVALYMDRGVFCVSIELNGKTATGRAAPDLTLHREKNRSENCAIGKAFVGAARAFTGYVPPFGTLTGVRPVKVPLFYLNSGYSRSRAVKILQEEFYVNRAKAVLLTELAEKERLIETTQSEVLLYLSVPFCPSRCRYCSFISSAAPKHLAMIPDYTDLLTREIEEIGKRLSFFGKSVSSVYMGGGTPGVLSPVQFDQILSLLDRALPQVSREYCVEIGRPDTVTEEKLRVLKAHGVDRISINPQTTSDAILEKIGRKHSADDFYRAMDIAAKVSFPTVNCDLIAGLSGDDGSAFLASLDSVLTYQPESVTIHALCRKRSAEESRPSALLEDWTGLVQTAHETCINHGLAPYYLYRQKNAVSDLENLGFSLPGHENRYNLCMMEDLSDVVACGAGAISKVVPRKPGQKVRRFSAPKYPFEYLSAPEKIPERLDALFQALTEESS